MANKITKQEREILIKAGIKLEGFNEMSKQLKNVDKANIAVQRLAEFAGMLKALSKTISDISRSGFGQDMKKIVGQVNTSLALLGDESMPNIQQGQVKRDNRSYSGKRRATKIIKSPEQIANYSSVAAPTLLHANLSVQEAMVNLSKQELAIKAAQKKLVNESMDEYKAHVKTATELTKKEGSARGSILSKIKEQAKAFFSLEKIMARVSFVLTAKLSYDLMNRIIRLPGQALSAWRDFQAEISKAFALLANESRATKDKLTKDVIGLSRTYGIAAKEISAAMYEVISAQVGVANASKVLEQAIKLSIAGGGDATTAAHSLVQIMNAYNISFDQASRVADIAFQSVKYGQLTLQQYTNEMSKVVATASILKVPIEEVSAAISTMTINGINANQAFTALNQMLMVIANPTERSKQLLSELGFNLSTSEIRAKGLGGALAELVPMLNMTGAANEELITILFKNRTGFKAVASLLQNMPEYFENYSRMINSAGAANEGLAERVNTVEFQSNRLKTTWDAMLATMVSGKNKEIISFYKSLTKTIDNLIENMDTLFAIVKSIVILISGQLIKKAMLFIGSSIATIIAGVKSLPLLLTKLKLSLTSVSVAAQATLASLTAGLSLVVTLLAEVILWASTAAKKIRDNRIDKAFGAEELARSIEDAEKRIDSLNTTIGQIDSVKKLVNQFESLYNIQKKNNSQNDAMERSFNAVASSLKTVGIDVKNLTIDTIDFANIVDQLIQKSNQLRSDIVNRETLKAKDESMLSIKEFEKSRKDLTHPLVAAPKITTKEELDNRARTSYVEQAKNIGIAGKTLMSNLSDAIKSKNQEKIDKEIDRIETWAKNNYEIFSGVNQENLEKIAKTNIDAIITLTGSLWTNMLELRKKRLDYDVETLDLGDKTQLPPPSGQEVSFLSDSENLLSSLFGEGTFDTIEELQDAMRKKVDEINDKIKEAQGKDNTTVKDLKATRDNLNRFLSVVDSKSFIQIVEEGNKTISKIAENAKNFRISGQGDLADSEIEKMLEVYQNFFSTVSNWGDVKPDAMSDQDWETFRRNTKTAAAQMFMDMMSKAREVMTDSDFVTFALQQYNIDPEVLGDWGKLDSAIKDAVASGDKGAEEFLKTFTDELMVGLQNQLNLIFGLYDSPDFINTAINSIRKKISDSEIKDPAEIEALIQQAVGVLRGGNFDVKDVDVENIRKSVMPESKEDEALNWKSMFGIKDYKDGNDAIVDVGQQAVGQLQNVWSFYWDWEIRKLQEQQAKKLELLQKEKDVMLANENMSAQQKALIEQKFQNKQKQLQDKLDKEMAEKKKKQAIFNASIDFARGLIGIWSSELSKGLFGAATAPILTGLLSGIFAAQMAMINNQKFASGGYTGSGSGSPDETGYKPAGIVHEGELVIDKKTLDRNNNLSPMMSLYQAMKSGLPFDKAVTNYLMGNLPQNSMRASQRASFAQGGLVGHGRINNATEHVTIDFKGIRTIDPIELNQIVEIGGKRRRKIGE